MTAARASRRADRRSPSSTATSRCGSACGGGWPWGAPYARPSCRWPTSTIACRRPPSRQHPVEPRDAARLLVDRGPGRRAGHRHVARPPRLCCDPATSSSSTTPGSLPGAAAPAARRTRRRGRGAAPRAASTPTRRAWRALVRPERQLRDGEVSLGDRRRSAGGRDRLRRGRHAARDRAADDVREDDSSRYGEMPLPPYITAALDDPSATRRCTPAGPRRRRRRRRACTSRRTCSTRSPAAASSVARRSSWSSGSTRSDPVTVDDPRDAPHAQRAIPRAAHEVLERAGTGRAEWSPSDHDERARSRARRRGPRCRGAPRCSSAAPFEFQRGRRAAHQLPPAPHRRCCC